MANYNKVIMIGNLTRDPQMSFLPSQTPVVEFGLAVNRRWRGQDGQNKEETCFIDCRCYGRQAETLNQYMAKGRPLLIEGRLQFDTWESKDGTKRSKHRVVIERFQFLGGAPASSRRPRHNEAAASGPEQHDESGPKPPVDHAPGGEDIPF